MSEKHSIVIEEYLLLLYQLRGAGERLKAVTLAQRLKSSAPTVHATPQRMQRDDLIQMDDKKEINLTKEGERLACDIAFRHNLAQVNEASLPNPDTSLSRLRLPNSRK